jgi:hypothetical protein
LKDCREVGAPASALHKKLDGTPSGIALELLTELIKRRYGLASDSNNTIADSKPSLPSWRLVGDINHGQAKSTPLDRLDDQAKVATSTLAVLGTFGDLSFTQETVFEDFRRSFGCWSGVRGCRVARSDHDRWLRPTWSLLEGGFGIRTWNRQFFSRLDHDRWFRCWLLSRGLCVSME